jgi:hypothetical protein
MHHHSLCGAWSEPTLSEVEGTGQAEYNSATVLLSLPALAALGTKNEA